MAGDGHHCHRGLDDRIAEEVQAQLGLLVVPLEQRSLDYLGSQRCRVCVNRASVCVGGIEHKGGCKESKLSFRRATKLPFMILATSNFEGRDVNGKLLSHEFHRRTTGGHQRVRPRLRE